MKPSDYGIDRGKAGRAYAISLLFCAALICVATMIGCDAKLIRREQTSTTRNFIAAAPTARTLGDLVPAQSLPARDEELWIVEKPGASGTSAQTPVAVDALERSPGSGMLLGVHGATLTPLPLEQTDVHANINGLIASVDVHQRFSNSSKDPADVVYAFPLAQNAAVNEFVMSIGKRHIRAIVRERAEAEQIYREARGQGYLASLMVQQSPNVFIQHVANLGPGAAVDVEIRYFHTVSCRDGWFEFEFPMIAGLRGEGMPRATQRNGKNISLAVHLNAGVALEGVECESHKLAVKKMGADVADATLEPADLIPNRDLVLRHKLAGDAVKASLTAEKDGDGGTFALMVLPPEKVEGIARRPLEVTFLMEADVENAGNAAVASMLRSLTSDDTFQIVNRGSGEGPSPMTSALPETVESCIHRLQPHDYMHSVTPQWPRDFRDPARTAVNCFVTKGQVSPVFSAVLAQSRAIVLGVGNNARSSRDRGHRPRRPRRGRLSPTRRRRRACRQRLDRTPEPSGCI